MFDAMTTSCSAVVSSEDGLERAEDCRPRVMGLASEHEESDQEHCLDIQIQVTKHGLRTHLQSKLSICFKGETDISSMLGNLSRISLQPPPSHEVNRVSLQVTQYTQQGAKIIVTVAQKNAKLLV